MPRLKGSLRTCTPSRWATTAVRSVEPSSTTTIAKPGSKARISSITRATVGSSLKAGTIAIRRRRASCGSTVSTAGWASSATRQLRGVRNAKPDQLEELPRTSDICVLVKSSLARSPSELLPCGRVSQELAVDLLGLVGVLGDDQLPSGVEPALDPFDRA